VLVKHNGVNNTACNEYSKGQQSVKVHTNSFSTVLNKHLLTSQDRFGYKKSGLPRSFTSAGITSKLALEN